MRVAILDDIHRAWEGTEGVRRLRERAEVRVFTGPFGDPAALRGFDAVIANRERTRFTRKLLEQLSDVRVLVQTGNHANHVDFAAARDCGIVVARASAGYSIGAAELTFGLAMAVMRQIPASDAALRRGEWPVPSTPVLHGKTLGVVGLGRIGRHVARLGKAFGMRVAGWSRTLTDEASAGAGTERRELDDLVGEADVVTIHASLSPSSRGLLDARRIALMKPTAFSSTPREARSSTRRPWSTPSRRGASPAPASTSSTASPCRPGILSRPSGTSCSRRTSAGRPTTATGASPRRRATYCSTTWPAAPCRRSRDTRILSICRNI